MSRRQLDELPVVFARCRDGTLWSDLSYRGLPDWERRAAWVPGGVVLFSPLAYDVEEPRVDADRLVDPSIVVRRRDGRTYVDTAYLVRVSPKDRIRIERRAEPVRSAATYFLTRSWDMMRPPRNPEDTRAEEVWKSSDQVSSSR